MKVERNTVTDNSSVQIQFDAFNSAATNEFADIKENTLDCDPADEAPGIAILERGETSIDRGDINNVKVQDNTIDPDCDPDIEYTGNTTQLDIGD